MINISVRGAELFIVGFFRFMQKRVEWA